MVRGKEFLQTAWLCGVPAIGRIEVADLKPYHVEELMAGMDTSRQTKLLVRAFLRMALNKIALKSGIVTTNVAALADTPKRTKKNVRYQLTPQDLQKILKAEVNPIRRAMYNTIATTGLRVTEATHLTWGELKERKNGMWIELNHSKTEAGLQRIPVPSETWQEIKALGKTSVIVFPSESGTPINHTNLRRAWLKTLKNAKVPTTTVYQLRKLFGSVHAKTANDVTLKRLMRHTDIRTTKQFYTDAFEDDLRAQVERK